MQRSSRLLIAVQASLMIVIIFGDIGFDHPGRFGLAFGSLLILGGALFVCCFVGLVRSVRSRAWSAAVLHLSLPFVAFVGMVAMEG